MILYYMYPLVLVLSQIIVIKAGIYGKYMEVVEKRKKKTV